VKPQEIGTAVAVLAAGHIHRGVRVSVNMALGQTIQCAPDPWGGAALAPRYDEYGPWPIKPSLENDFNLLVSPKVLLSN
jgi:hypothetical protein